MQAKIHPPVISQDTRDFLESLLFTADSPDESRRPFQNSTVYDFHPEFAAAVESFIAGFKTHLENVGFDMDRLKYLSRSFGGNVYFSLSGHGCGFFDEYADPERTLGDELQALLVGYAGQHRFEELDGNLAKFKGKIHLAYRTAAFRREYLAKVFTVSPVAWAIRTPEGYLANQGSHTWHESSPVGWALFSTESHATSICPEKGYVVPVFSSTR